MASCLLTLRRSFLARIFCHKRRTNIVPGERANANTATQIPHQHPLALWRCVILPPMVAKRKLTAAAVKHRILAEFVAGAAELFFEPQMWAIYGVQYHIL